MNLSLIQGVTGAPLSTAIRGNVRFFILMPFTATILDAESRLALWFPELLD
jgi:hypothetical protein